MAVLAALMFLSYPSTPAEAQETPETPGVEVEDGTVRIGDDVFAGDGCARAGDVVAGDCDESPESQGKDQRQEGPADDTADKKDAHEEAGADEEQPSEENLGGTTVQEESTTPRTTGSGTTVGRTLGTESNSDATTRAGTTAGESLAVCPTAPPEDAAPATVAQTVDGDTVELKDAVDGYDTVRLIGVDAPEMEGEDGSPEPGAEKASQFTTDSLEGREVLLETDEELEDQYSRLLAYVWLVPETGEPELFNSTLVADGYAETMTVEPNDAYAECFEAQAEDGGSGPEKAHREDEESNAGLLGRLRDLLSSEASGSGEDTAGPVVSEDQYQQNGSTGGPGSTGLKETEALEPSGGETGEGESALAPPADTGKTTEGTTDEDTDLPIANPEAEDLAALPPESCPGASVVLEPFGTNGGVQSDPFEVTGDTFVVRADLKSETPDEARLDVSILDTEAQEPVEEFDQRAVGSYDTTISQGPGSYLLSLHPESGSYEVIVFDCAEQEPEQGVGEDAYQEPEKEPGAPLELESSTSPEAPQAPESGGSEAPIDQPAELEFVAGHEPVSPEYGAEPSGVDLPTREESSDEVAVLPDTGGPGPGAGLLLVVVVGVLAVVAGIANLAFYLGIGRSPAEQVSTDGQ
ncbi:MAG: thermonuclease family protein [Rubrobacteraceae bacterium]